MAAPPNDIILYHYTFSPFAQRVQDYLALRGLSYAQCMQPPMIPRPDLSEHLNIQYRRIPLLAIGNHVYADTRLILQKLEEKFPNSNLSASTSDQKGIERLLSRFTIDAGVFNRAGQLLPPDLPLLKDDKFVKDRESLLPGSKWGPEAKKQARPEALVHMRCCFEELEHGLLADGRDWILKTTGPSLADIEAVWPFKWMMNTPGMLEPAQLFSKDRYPRVHAWIQRYQAAVKAAQKQMGKPVSLKGPQAAEFILSSQVKDKGRGVDAEDPLGLQENASIAVYPIDYGFSHKDVGRLTRLDKEEVAIEIDVKSKGKKVWLHCPRWGFRVKQVEGNSKL